MKNEKIKENKIKAKPIASLIQETSDTATVISLQQKVAKLQIQIKSLKIKLFKCETKHMKQERKIIKLQLENDNLKIEKPGIEEILRSIDERKSKHEGFIDLSIISNAGHIEPPEK